MSSVVSLPGFNAPAVGFEQPFEMLQACHERVQRTLRLLERLLEHVQAKGHDASSRSAASDVLRYFDIAAPHHHADEELHVFPVALAGGDARMRDAVAKLQADHVRMNALWGQLRLVLLAWCDATPGPSISSADRELVEQFVRCYEEHIPLEETLVYPAASSALDADRLVSMGTEMASRRR